MIYPSIESAAVREPGESAPATARTSLIRADTWAKIWSEELNCKVRFSEPNEVFMCLKEENSFVHVLFGEKQGWIRNESRLKIERIK